jgi:hypothetical protein
MDDVLLSFVLFYFVFLVGSGKNGEWIWEGHLING